jgi:hypothetical protein
MSAIDRCEPETIRAFEKDGWTIRERPFVIRMTPKQFFFADVSFEKNVNGRGENIIVVEIKCFSNPMSDMDEFYRAVGQYIVYRTVMLLNNIAGRIYLSIPKDAYERFVRLPLFAEALRSAHISYVIIDLEQEEIVAWNP